MGRTKRKRKKKRENERNDWTVVINLQKTMKVKCGNIRVGHFKETGRGIRCTRNIEKGDTLIALPLRNLITPDSTSKVFSLLKGYDRHPQLDLSVLLIYESHLDRDSEYYCYLSTLPESYSNLFFCTAREADLLPNSLKKLLTEQKKKVESLFEKLVYCLNDSKCPHCGMTMSKLARDKFIWAWFTVNTRSVYYEDEEHNKLMALAPLLDMFNHSSEAQTDMSIDFNNQLYILKTNVGFKKDTQAYINYGSHSNLTLLLEYGFILPVNPYDEVKFTFEEIVDCVKQYSHKYGSISKLKYNFILSNRLNQNLVKTLDEFSWNMNSLIYVLIAEDENLGILQSKTYSSELTRTEQQITNTIKEALVQNKLQILKDELSEMEHLKNCTESFRLAKEFVKTNMAILQKNLT
ncbi:hypothetical protein RUM43_001911 [Polyplax serrata]|uniref:SET domain-containing protein n=1 Tax=Polyplax serrata TaxID=468196 RepID=A0AAN8SJT0_POLSC